MVESDPESRSILRFHTRNGYIRLAAEGGDIKPPWCAEYWVYLLSAQDEIQYLMKEAWRWQEVYEATKPQNLSWYEKETQLKRKIKAFKVQGQKGILNCIYAC